MNSAVCSFVSFSFSFSTDCGYACFCLDVHVNGFFFFFFFLVSVLFVWLLRNCGIEIGIQVMGLSVEYLKQLKHVG
jgi:hypothetical protein